VTETVGEHDRYGVERLRALTLAHRSDSPGELLSAIAAALAEFRSGSHEDDVAMLALRPRR
jgi:serine phosphatase RsbU (regulator of sigma subunit)